MYDVVKLTHLVAAIFWMGGMAFMLLALRPAALAVMDPQSRARLMGAVWQRFFLIVIVSIVALFTTGTNLYTTAFRAAKAATGSGSVPLGWNLMLVVGIVMMLIFGHIYFAGFRKFKRAVAAAEWPVAAKAAAQVQTLVLANFVLGCWPSLQCGWYDESAGCHGRLVRGHLHGTSPRQWPAFMGSRRGGRHGIHAGLSRVGGPCGPFVGSAVFCLPR